MEGRPHDVLGVFRVPRVVAGRSAAVRHPDIAAALSPGNGRNVDVDVLVTGPLQGGSGSDRGSEHGAAGNATNQQHANDDPN